MIKLFLVFIHVLFITNNFSQNNDKTYLTHGHNYSFVYSYAITEISIHSDSTYTKKNYSLLSKKERKTYKEYKPEVSNGKITKSGNYWILTEYRNGNKTDFSWTVKISNKKIVFFFPNGKGKMRRTAIYKRIYTD